MSLLYAISFDVGSKNIGVAVGQNITRTAKPINSLKAIHGIPDIKKIKKLFNIWNPNIIIIGLPLNMDGSIQNSINLYINKFINFIKRNFKIKIKLCDERLTTIEARSKIFKLKGYKYLKKSKIDSESASIILENWFNKNI
ncbi:Holliday junction resolvase RuvX [Sodalis-like secondary symbiont of Drepanosiphum platanoidis]|uniref:Holliday junction resolvase RuvX n=1 Tax=Sodalis-like secondary symbiont of Drepanosiphum platanoidis TaxID=2994493 RepID=UPI003463CB85